MNEREQLAIRKTLRSKRFMAGRGLAAMTLGDLQREKRRVAKRVCAKHTWVVSKWSQRCSVCGLVEDRCPVGLRVKH